MKKGEKARPFCTGYLYVWEELLKIKTDMVVNTNKGNDWYLSSDFPHNTAESRTEVKMPFKAQPIKPFGRY